MKILVVGGAGKLGRAVVQELLQPQEGSAGHAVTVLDRQVGPDSERVNYLVGDHTDLGQVIGAVAGMDVVIHLAAIYRQATGDVIFDGNVLGTFNVHEAAWRLRVPRVVSTSSRAILGWTYGLRPFPPAYLPIDEEHPVRPQDPYGLSKKVGEAIAQSYTDRCGMETVVLRPSAVMAPEQMRELARTGGRKTTRFDTCTYVDLRDQAVAYRLAAQRPMPGHTVLWTVADDSIASEPLAILFPRLLPETKEMAQVLSETQGAITNARARHVLGWNPQRTWRDPTTL